MSADPLRTAADAARRATETLLAATEESSEGWSDDGRRSFDAAHLNNLTDTARQVVRQIDELAVATRHLEQQRYRFR